MTLQKRSHVHSHVVCMAENSNTQNKGNEMSIIAFIIMVMMVIELVRNLRNSGAPPPKTYAAASCLRMSGQLGGTLELLSRID